MPTFNEFQSSLSGSQPPADCSAELAALWWDGHNDWDAAHTAIQALDGESAAWVHAYLHRKEGDISNARYWYRRAHRDESSASLDEEWAAIARTLLDLAAGGSSA